MQNPATIYVVRHAQTDWNAFKRIQGHTDIPLNKAGEEQAYRAKDLFNKIHFDAVFSSDLLRAKKTAEIITLERDLTVMTTVALRERNFGELEGAYIAEISNMEKVLDTLSHEERFVHKMTPNMENDEELVGRFITFVREVSVAYAGKHVLMVSHGALLRMFLIHLGVGTYQSLGHGTIENTAYIKMLADGTDFAVQELYGVHIQDK